MASKQPHCGRCKSEFSDSMGKTLCRSCNETFCLSCVKRDSEGAWHSNTCFVLSQWPLDKAKMKALRVKDLRVYLHSRNINSKNCIEKSDLIDLVIKCISNEKRKMSDDQQLTGDDGIRVKSFDLKSGNTSNESCIRGRAGPSRFQQSDYDLATEKSPISKKRARDDSPMSVDSYSGSGDEGTESLDRKGGDIPSWHKPTSRKDDDSILVNHCRKKSKNKSNVESIRVNPEHSKFNDRPTPEQRPQCSSPMSVDSCSGSDEEDSNHTANTDKTSDKFEELKVLIQTLKSEEDINRLSIRQCKEILVLHEIDLFGVNEKSELTKKIAQLVKEYQGRKRDHPSQRKSSKNNSQAGETKNTAPNTGKTLWAHNDEGDVKIAEICYNSVENKCPNSDVGCQRLHSVTHYHWQVLESGTNWLNLHRYQVIVLERSFCDVGCNSVKLPRVDPTKHSGPSSKLLNLLGRDCWTADFNSVAMKITDSQKDKQLLIRRLCTEVVHCKRLMPSKFAWYFLDKKKNWIEYGQTDSVGAAQMVGNLTSDTIESHYLKDMTKPIPFQNLHLNYTLDFQSMKQINQKTKVSRPVRRRPLPHLENVEQQMENHPSDRDGMQLKNPLKRLLLEPSSEEYKKIMNQHGNHIEPNNVIRIERVQNIFHRRAFQNKISEMTALYRDDSKLDIRSLFHGTSAAATTSICLENFDHRLHGIDVGQKYGQGTYFSRDFRYSYPYCKPDKWGFKYMFIAKVAVGSVTRGEPSMTRPPINSATGVPFDSTVDDVKNPFIIVKYDKAEYYPQYIITMK